jgi:transcriptional regulator with XRE-family HTH domain
MLKVSYKLDYKAFYKILDEKGLTFASVAKLSTVSPSHVASLVSSAKCASLEIATAISNALGVKLEALFEKKIRESRRYRRVLS